MYYSISYNDNIASINDTLFCLRVYVRDKIEFIHNNQILCIRFGNSYLNHIELYKYKNDFIRLATKLLNILCIPELITITKKIKSYKSI